MNVVVIFLLISISGLFAIHNDVDLGKIFASYFYYILCIQQQVDSQDKNIDDHKQEIVPYEKKYMDEFVCMENIKVSKEKMESLKNCYIIDYTPVGNVAMAYDSKKEAFVYFADHIVPYRYLETLARKYALTYMCKGIVVTTKMNLLFKNDESVVTDGESTEKSGDEKDTAETDKETRPVNEPPGCVLKDDNSNVEKKDVFAKFKTYNKGSIFSTTTSDRGDNEIHYNDHVNITEDSQSKKDNDNKNEKTEDNTNRYSCEGRFANFILTKKPDMSLFNTRLKMSFADFKKQKSSV